MAGLTAQPIDSNRPGEVDRQNCPPTLGGKKPGQDQLCSAAWGAQTWPPAPGAGVGGRLAGSGSQVKLGVHAGLTCSPPGSWPGSRRPSGWSSPAASGPAARWGHSPAAPAVSGSKRASEGHQSLARTATSGARSASSQLADKSPEQRAQPKAQACWFTRLLTKVLRHSTEPTATPRTPVSYSLTPWAQPLPPRGYRGDSARLQVLRPELARPSTGTVQISGPLFFWVLPIS